MSLSVPPPFARLRELTASGTLQASDHYGYVLMNVATANTLTVPASADVPMALGTLINVTQMGAGETSIVAGTDVTIFTPGSLIISAQFATIALVKLTADEWLMSSL